MTPKLISVVSARATLAVMPAATAKAVHGHELACAYRLSSLDALQLSMRDVSRELAPCASGGQPLRCSNSRWFELARAPRASRAGALCAKRARLERGQKQLLALGTVDVD